MIKKEIIAQCEFGCLIPPPNIVILTPTSSSNDDNEIFCATQMYKEEFLLNDNKYLDICMDEAIFRSYGIFHLATAIGIRFLDRDAHDKLQAIVNYRSARRVLELLWVAIGIAIHIYAKKKNIDNLVEVFQIDNYREYELFKKNPPSQLTSEGLEKLNNAYKEGLKRIKEVHKINKILTKKKAPENTPYFTSHGISQQQLSPKNSNRQLNIPNDGNPASKYRRIVTTEEEKEILNPLLLKSTVLTEEDILENLPSTWNIQRVKRYYNNNNKKTKLK
ncbi:hypothetical protein RhiirA4_477739 [Rhizophagus irregularis]|uniref:Uncharacterized protein n=1 Tax=Rhizophagus irregularis TaxID=588596 RepID=A0A2I1H487_9GLOM|nr:hypothetical protein RhiirA4_472060 [Rhizophagus irregularis]PKY57010.1 hypothetical protein RhiirA4_477739 [Rhizophagus irregularis]